MGELYACLKFFYTRFNHFDIKQSSKEAETSVVYSFFTLDNRETIRRNLRNVQKRQIFTHILIATNACKYCQAIGWQLVTRMVWAALVWAISKLLACTKALGP